MPRTDGYDLPAQLLVVEKVIADLTLVPVDWENTSKQFQGRQSVPVWCDLRLRTVEKQDTYERRMEAEPEGYRAYYNYLVSLGIQATFYSRNQNITSTSIHTALKMMYGMNRQDVTRAFGDAQLSLQDVHLLTSTPVKDKTHRIEDSTVVEFYLNAVMTERDVNVLYPMLEQAELTSRIKNVDNSPLPDILQITKEVMP